jgi:hypothetical protein
LAEDGTFPFEVPTGSIELAIDLSGSGFLPQLLDTVDVGPDREDVPVTAELRRGLEVRLMLEEGSPAVLASGEHLIFALRSSELGAVRGPLSEDSSDVTHHFDQLHLHLDDPTLSSRLVSFEGRFARLSGIPEGTYSLRAFPDDIAFEPEAFKVRREPEEPILVHCRRR